MTVVWTFSVVILIVLVPAEVRWAMEWTLLTVLEGQQSVVWAATYLLAVAVCSQLSMGSERPLSPAAIVAVSLACWCAGFGFLILHPDVGMSYVLALVEWLASTTALLVAFRWPRVVRRVAPLAFAVAVGSVVVSRNMGSSLASAAMRSPDGIVTALYRLRMTEVADFEGRVDALGGGLAVLPTGLLLVSGDGQLYGIHQPPDDTVTIVTPYLARVPFNRDQFNAAAMRIEDRAFRVTSILVDTVVRPAQLFVAHDYWDVSNRCLRIRVTRGFLPSDPTTDIQWQTIFDSRPCLGLTDNIDTFESGGRLAWGPRGNIALSVGDFGLNGIGVPAVAQDTGSDYGKVFLLTRSGERRRLSHGHRNIQGMVTDSSGTLWSVEHGPRGGDEVNILKQGRNYGWPYVTSGTDYGAFTWPLSPPPGTPTAFVPPRFAFLPAIAPSSLTVVSGPEFAAWRGDLLVGTLRAQSIYRLRLRGDRVVYAEPIVVDHRVRDVVVDRNGALLLWTEEAKVIALREAVATVAESTYVTCAVCHGLDLRGTKSGPSLRGIVGRSVAIRADYPYTSALVRFGGRWTPDRLNAFLANPNRVVPGTSMHVDGITDKRTRAALIEYLRDF